MPWLVGFVVLTICAERVELARLAMPSTGGPDPRRARGGPHPRSRRDPALARRRRPAHRSGHRLARRLAGATRRGPTGRSGQPGCPASARRALLGGYVWLLARRRDVGGRGWRSARAAAYDLVVHSVMLGFAISMVMAHAPVILPAVLRRPLPYRAMMWIPLVLMHIGLVIRVVRGRPAWPPRRSGRWARSSTSWPCCSSSPSQPCPAPSARRHRCRPQPERTPNRRDSAKRSAAATGSERGPS